MSRDVFPDVQSAMDDKVLTKTLCEHSHLFKIVTPIHVDVFESYLSTHPNQAFVKSVCKGLHKGFWPWADISKPGYPDIVDESKPAPTDMKKANFLRTQTSKRSLLCTYRPQLAAGDVLYADLRCA